MKNKIFHISLLLLIPCWIVAQDLHFSNFQSFKSYFNPATTGNQAAVLTANIQHRSQWANIPQAYQSTGLNIQQKKGRFAWGGLLHKNGAGAASLETTGGLFTGAFYQQLAKGENELALGIGLGFIQKGFDPSALKFDEQYRTESGFDIANSNGETFIQTSTKTIDFSIGALWKGAFIRNKTIKTQVGLALSHVHLPKMGFQAELNELPLKIVAHGQLTIPISSKGYWQPYFLYQKQNAHQSTLVGVQNRRQINPQTALKSGVGYRFKDALILQAGIEWGNKALTLSYDLNNSNLARVTRGQGAIELAFAIKFGKKSKIRKKDRDKDGIYDLVDKCPDIPGLKEFKGCPVPKKEMAEDELDTDGDRVPDIYDDCPTIKGYRHLFGCPDTDKDGVIDPDDACPRLPGLATNSGCPYDEKDTDRDGVPDSQDYCIFLRGDAKFHGCPDSDKDGISDIDDECPYLKGTKANNGCPGNNRPQNDLKAIVEFETDQHFIHPEFAAELDFLIQEVGTATDYKIMISGHTDSEGNAAYNYALGQKRAFGIQNYLVERGINAFKIQTISYGEARPKQKNESYTGKAKNRRAEVVVIME